VAEAQLVATEVAPVDLDRDGKGVKQPTGKKTMGAIEIPMVISFLE
jgi:hypothetical protein